MKRNFTLYKALNDKEEFHTSRALNYKQKPDTSQTLQTGVQQALNCNLKKTLQRPKL